MEIWTAIKEAPEWVALLVALGGLAFQQRQIRQARQDVSAMQDQLNATTRSEVDFLRDRMDRLHQGLEDVRLALMRKTDLKE